MIDEKRVYCNNNETLTRCKFLNYKCMTPSSPECIHPLNIFKNCLGVCYNLKPTFANQNLDCPNFIQVENPEEIFGEYNVKKFKDKLAGKKNE